MPSNRRLKLLRGGCTRFARASQPASASRILSIVGPVTLAAASAGLFLILSEAGSTPALSQTTGQTGSKSASDTSSVTAEQAAKAAMTGTPLAQVPKPDCATQQWPYVDERCTKEKDDAAPSTGMRKVRVIGRDGKSRIILSARPEIDPAKAAPSHTAKTAPKPAPDGEALTPLHDMPVETKTAKTDPSKAAATEAQPPAKTASSPETTPTNAAATENVADQSATSGEAPVAPATVANVIAAENVPLPRAKPEVKPEPKRQATRTAAAEPADKSRTADKDAKAKRIRTAKAEARASRDRRAERKRRDLADAVAIVRSLPDDTDGRRVVVRYGRGQDGQDRFMSSGRIYYVPAGRDDAW